MPRGRKRKPGQEWMPEGVYLDRYGFYMRDPYRRIGPPDMPRSEIYAIVENDEEPRGSLGWLVRQYLASERFNDLAERTRKDAKKALDRVIKTKIRNGTFAKAPLKSITPGVIRKYMDARTAKVAANREVNYLSMAFSWSFERELVKQNPCKGVRRNKEKPVERYVTDEEYLAAYKRAPEKIQIAMELAFLCAARKSEVLDLKRSDLLPEGVLIRRRKGSKKNIVQWSPRLEQAINRALALPADIGSMYLLHDRQGQPIRESSFDTAWQRLKAGFRFHDLKAKGVSDSTAHNPAGHKSPAMIQLYKRKIEEVEPPK